MLSAQLPRERIRRDILTYQALTPDTYLSRTFAHDPLWA